MLCRCDGAVGQVMGLKAHYFTCCTHKQIYTMSWQKKPAWTNWQALLSMTCSPRAPQSGVDRAWKHWRATSRGSGGPQRAGPCCVTYSTGLFRKSAKRAGGAPSQPLADKGQVLSPRGIRDVCQTLIAILLWRCPITMRNSSTG